jgi:hypothetical protein
MQDHEKINFPDHENLQKKKPDSHELYVQNLWFVSLKRKKTTTIIEGYYRTALSKIFWFKEIKTN